MRASLLLLLLFPWAVSLLGAQERPPTPLPGLQRECAGKAFRSVDRSLKSATYADNTIDVTYYELNLDITSLTGTIAGSVLVKARPVIDSLNAFILDLSDPLTVDSVVSEGFHTPFIRYVNGVGVGLPRFVRKGEIAAARVFYHGNPAGTGFGSYEVSYHSGTAWTYSLSEPYGARDWWPCKDHPLDKADSADILVRCPQSFKVASNGRLVSVTPNGDGSQTYHWAERYPIAAYLVSIAVTNYAEFSDWYHYGSSDSLQILNYVLPENLESARTALGKAVHMMDIFSRRYGPYPFLKEKYGHADFGSGGAMEHQTMTSTTTYNENTIAHELAHQWFGDLITCANWQELWLNEGFASYSEAVYFEADGGAEAYRNQIEPQLSLAVNAQGSLYVQDTSNVRSLFAVTRVYAKGASVLHMLRHVLGDSTFFRALRAYVADPRYRYGNATTRDFQGVCEAVSGQALGYFFDEWVFGENYPFYGFIWNARPLAEGYAVDVTIDQMTRTVNPSFFTMPLDIRFGGTGWDSTLTVFHTSSGQTFSFTLPRKPESVALDPDHWILRDFYDSRFALPDQFVLEQNYPNPFNAGTTIRFQVPHRSYVGITVFDLLGRQVATLADGTREPGSYEVTWSGVADDGTTRASGVYICRMIGAEQQQTQRMLLLR
jgi:aminopeptidase N